MVEMYSNGYHFSLPQLFLFLSAAVAVHGAVMANRQSNGWKKVIGLTSVISTQEIT